MNAHLNSFVTRIEQMNETFDLPSNDTLTDQGPDRIGKFYEVLSEEIEEIWDVHSETDPASCNYVALADLLADITVYVFSEARRWGIPIVDVLHAVMDSQDSKLVDGKALMAEDGSKFIKGPDYIPPEDKIAAILERYKK